MKNRYTGQDEEPDERLMRSIEEKIDIPESRKDDFRREIMNYIGALAVDGKKFEYNTNDRLRKALELKLFEDQKDSDQAQDAGLARSSTRTRRRRSTSSSTRLIKNFGYNEISATDVLNYVASDLRPRRREGLAPRSLVRSGRCPEAGAAARPGWTYSPRLGRALDMSSLKKTLMQQGMKLMSRPRVMKLMQDERVMKAMMAAMSVPGKAQTFARDQAREHREGDGAGDRGRSEGPPPDRAQARGRGREAPVRVAAREHLEEEERRKQRRRVEVEGVPRRARPSEAAGGARSRTSRTATTADDGIAKASRGYGTPSQAARFFEPVAQERPGHQRRVAADDEIDAPERYRAVRLVPGPAPREPWPHACGRRQVVVVSGELFRTACDPPNADWLAAMLRATPSA